MYVYANNQTNSKCNLLYKVRGAAQKNTYILSGHVRSERALLYVCSSEILIIVTSLELRLLLRKVKQLVVSALKLFF